ncbi:hypothetical protein CTI12_AA117020 [Artemisia annua]|uniref:Uncharacterized protein n=1 Tax=Artemisia annua TaxID=35608 RepID=A0A2U1PSV4_ARTAN|nr:hypothetical protein CTI12_AA117020 [Artemisia annua]
MLLYAGDGVLIHVFYSGNRLSRCGEYLTDCLIKSLEIKGVEIRPRYSFKQKEVWPGEFQAVDLDFPNTTESCTLYCQREIASDIK